MAIYSTFFLSKPDELAGGFPGWRLPLSQSVRREFKNPFTGKISTIETREPEWTAEDDEVFEANCHVVAVESSYQDYLRGRLPPFVRASLHWATKGLTEVELRPLFQILGVDAEFVCPLYRPPSLGAVLQELSSDFLSKLESHDERALEAVAEKWATTMSTPRRTHSVTGVKLSDGWTTRDAMGILQAIVALRRKATEGQRMYLLNED